MPLFTACAHGSADDCASRRAALPQAVVRTDKLHRWLRCTETTTAGGSDSEVVEVAEIEADADVATAAAAAPASISAGGGKARAAKGTTQRRYGASRRRAAAAQHPPTATTLVVADSPAPSGDTAAPAPPLVAKRGRGRPPGTKAAAPAAGTASAKAASVSPTKKAVREALAAMGAFEPRATKSVVGRADDALLLSMDLFPPRLTTRLAKFEPPPRTSPRASSGRTIAGTLAPGRRPCSSATYMARCHWLLDRPAGPAAPPSPSSSAAADTGIHQLVVYQKPIGSRAVDHLRASMPVPRSRSTLPASNPSAATGDGNSSDAGHDDNDGDGDGPSGRAATSLGRITRRVLRFLRTLAASPEASPAATHAAMMRQRLFVREPSLARGDAELYFLADIGQLSAAVGISRRRFYDVVAVLETTDIIVARSRNFIVARRYGVGATVAWRRVQTALMCHPTRGLVGPRAGR